MHFVGKVSSLGWFTRFFLKEIQDCHLLSVQQSAFSLMDGFLEQGIVGKCFIKFFLVLFILQDHKFPLLLLFLHHSVFKGDIFVLSSSPSEVLPFQDCHLEVHALLILCSVVSILIFQDSSQYFCPRGRLSVSRSDFSLFPFFLFHELLLYSPAPPLPLSLVVLRVCSEDNAAGYRCLFFYLEEFEVCGFSLLVTLQA